MNDYMTNYMLYRLTKRSNIIMSDMLRIHVGFTPGREILLKTDVDEILEEQLPRPSDTCKVCLGQSFGCRIDHKCLSVKNHLKVCFPKVATF